ncbi:MAG: acyltransferase [Acutalibacteraceae bacterium]
MPKIKNWFWKIRVALADNEGYVSLLRRKGVTIGAGCSVHKDVTFGTEPYLITLGDHVRITHGVRFITHDGGLWVPRNMGLVDKRADKFGKITVGNNVNIGWNAIIMPGVCIGDNCIVGAGAVVTKDIPANSVVAGVPAKVIESVEEYVEKNRDQFLMTKGLTAGEKRREIERRFF